MSKTAKDPAEFILPLYMNGLSGRMIKMPAPKNKKREILLIAGHHTSHERMFGLAAYLKRYGSVTSPDLPGFGGMEPFYKIGEKPTLDNLADYLAAFIKFRYRNRRYTIMAISVGFSIVTRMLQRYPAMAKNIDLLISVSGFVDAEAFLWKPYNHFILLNATRLFSLRPVASFIKHVCLRGPVIKSLYAFAEAKHPKLKDANPSERKERLDFEINLWKINDFRTYSAVGVWMLTGKAAKEHVNLEVYHVAVDDDHYFDHLLVEQHMRRIYKDFHLIRTKLPAHAPTVLATAEDVLPFVPRKIRNLLKQGSRK